MEKNNLMKMPTKDVKLNQFGNRVIDNWCLYARKLEERRRMQEKKKISVSRITEKDQEMFVKALKKLKRLRAKAEGPKRLALKKLAMSRAFGKSTQRAVKLVEDDNYVKCVIDYKQDISKEEVKKEEKPEPQVPASKRNKPQIVLPPLKTKPWSPPGPPKRKPRPVVLIPPFKTRPWVPCRSQIKPKMQPTIKYPPIKLRKTPWKSPMMATKEKTPKVAIRVRLDKTFYPSAVTTLGRTWHLFKFFTPKTQILRGRMSQYSKRFNFRTNGKQSAFIAIVALINAHICPMKHWGREDLDEIVSYGDSNCRKQMIQLRRQIPMKPSDVQSKIYLKRAKIFFEIGSRTLKGIFDVQNKKDLQNEMEQMISDFGCLIFHYCGQSYAIWKEHKAYYIFNAEDTDENGKLVAKTRGACCVIRSPGGITNIVEYLSGLLRVPKKCYEIYSFRVNEKISMNEEINKLLRQPNESKDQEYDENVNLSAFSGYNLYTSSDNVRVIRAKEERTIEWSRENVSMGICYAIAMLCISRSLDPEFYTRDVIDRIIIFGNDLVAECAEICFNDFDLCNKSPCPNEVNWNFELNNVHTNIQMDIFKQGKVSTHPYPAPSLKNSIEEFFNFYSTGILVTLSFVVAIWKDDNEFFIFYLCPIDEAGKTKLSEVTKTEIEMKLFPGLVAVQSIEALYENIVGNIEKDSYCKPFELRVCNLTMTDLCNVNQTPCEPYTISSCEEELVIPAVIVPPEFEPSQTKTNDAEKEKVHLRINELEESKEKIKPNRSPGFVEFGKRSLICGRLSKSSKRFVEFTRKYHSSAICLMSIAMTSLKDLNCWCSDTIDDVITSGNSLFIESCVANTSKELDMSELITSLNLFGYKINIRTEPFVEIPSENLTLKSLSINLCKMFSNHINGYLSRGIDCWAMFKRGKSYFIFDPLGIELKAKKGVHRRAVLYKFESVNLMAEQLMNSLKEVFDEDSEEVCVIGAVLCCPTNACAKEINKTLAKKTLKAKAEKCEKPIELEPSQFLMTLNEIESICEEENEDKFDDCNNNIENFCAN